MRREGDALSAALSGVRLHPSSPALLARLAVAKLHSGDLSKQGLASSAVALCEGEGGDDACFLSPFDALSLLSPRAALAVASRYAQRASATRAPAPSPLALTCEALTRPLSARVRVGYWGACVGRDDKLWHYLWAVLPLHRWEAPRALTCCFASVRLKQLGRSSP